MFLVLEPNFFVCEGPHLIYLCIFVMVMELLMSCMQQEQNLSRN
jgi:hypothetical protein